MSRTVLVLGITFAYGAVYCVVKQNSETVTHGVRVSVYLNGPLASSAASNPRNAEIVLI